jgi:hypothetical protein
MLLLLLSRASKPNYMKIDVSKLIILSGKMQTRVINSRAWAHNDLRRFLRMYLTGYTLTEIGDYFDMTYGSVYSAITINLISDLSYFKPMHQENRKRLQDGTRLMSVAEYEDSIKPEPKTPRKPKYHSYWDERGRWVVEPY